MDEQDLHLDSEDTGPEPMGTEPMGTEPMGTEPMGTEPMAEEDTEVFYWALRRALERTPLEPPAAAQM